MGVRVSGESPDTKASTGAPQRFTLRLREEPNRYGNRPGYRVDAEGIEASRVSPGSIPGPVIVLTRGEPAEIQLVNMLPDPTAIHWHGIELDSYFDGVPGWGGHRGSTTPPVEPGGTFTAKFTPPRAGTFIYHTHWHDGRNSAAACTVRRWSWSRVSATTRPPIMCSLPVTTVRRWKDAVNRWC